MVGAAGIEPATAGLEIRCSIRLSYAPSVVLGVNPFCHIPQRRRAIRCAGLLRNILPIPASLCQSISVFGEELAMKKIRYGVAMSLDGMIAGPNGEADWIVADPEVNFAEIWSRFDTLLMGRRTFEAAVARLGGKSMDGRKVVVIS